MNITIFYYFLISTLIGSTHAYSGFPNRRISNILYSFNEEGPPIVPPLPSSQTDIEDSEAVKTFKGFGRKKAQSVPEPNVEMKIQAKLVEPPKSVGDINVEKEILSTKMFKNIEKKREEALNEKIQRLREEEELIASDPSVGAVPELIANRMIGF